MFTLVVFSVAECTFGGFNSFLYLHFVCSHFDPDLETVA